MPWAPPRVCPTHRLRLPRGGRCPACQRAYDQTRPLTHRLFFNSPQWRLLRLQVLQEEPWCACGCGRASLEVDHVISRAKRPDLALVRGNLRAMARACHARKTRGEAP